MKRSAGRSVLEVALAEEPWGESLELASIVEKKKSLAVFARGLPFRFIHAYNVHHK